MAGSNGNGRGSFADALMAAAGARLASDAARVRAVEAQSATFEYDGGTFTIKPGQVWDYKDGPAPSRITRITTQSVEYTCEADGCRGHEVSVIDFCTDLINLGGRLRESDNTGHLERGVDAPHPAVATAEKTSDTAQPAAAAQAEDPVAEVHKAAALIRESEYPFQNFDAITVDATAYRALLQSIRRLSAGKVAKPATLHKPHAAASANDFATAVEAAEPAPADPLAQAMALIPNTYVEDENNLCAAISNMVSHIDRLKRSVERLAGNEAVNRVCESCRAAVKAAMGKGDIPGVVKTGQN